MDTRLATALNALIAQSIPIEGISTGPSGVPGVDAIAQYNPAQSPTSDQIATVQAYLANAANWVLPPVPNVTQFQAQIAADYQSGAISFAVFAALCNWAGTLPLLIPTPALLQKAWSDLCASGALAGTYPSGTTIIAQIEAYATANSIPLVA